MQLSTLAPRPQPTLDTLLALAPTTLRAPRGSRYDGGGFAVSLASFAPKDQQILSVIYHAVRGLYDRWLAHGSKPYAALRSDVEAFGSDLLQEATSLGTASRQAGRMTPLMRMAVHDIRGGGLCLLSNIKEVLALAPEIDPILKMAVYSARDHAKIMRHAVTDLDPARQQADEGPRPHYTHGLVEAWQNAVIEEAGREVRVTVNCTYGGAITGCCLEMSALDRVFYNLVTNAARFSADGWVSVDLFKAGPALIRIVVANAVTPEEQAWLGANAGAGLKRLFEQGITNGGTGQGLATCAEIIAACFRLPEIASALEAGYLGAKMKNGVFYAWFHWPVL